MTIQEMAKTMKLASPFMAATDVSVRNRALQAVADKILEKKDAIIEANEKDLAKAKEDGIPDSVQKRLRFGDKKINDVVAGIKDLIGLEDPVGKVQLQRELDADLVLTRVSCPIGVIGVIFESRPDAMVQISTLCIKSGNCAILKGGSEALNTNRVVFNIIKEAAVRAGIPEGALFQVEAREEINELLSCHEYVDLLIPRGSNSFVQYIMNNTKIPVMGHADGI